MNKVTLIGRIGRDPETRTFSNGGRVVSFSLATSERWKDKATGERKERTEWHNVQIFNEHLGKIAENYLKKGSMCALEGQIQTREYTDKEGAQRKVTEIVLPAFGGFLELLGGDKADGGRAPQQAAPAQQSHVGLGDQLNDEVPFMMEWR